ncbi:coiled-coil domain-containing protein 169 isoform X2 [Sphaerodactylus townsendi]|uniref:coiled-coil domain-containing protein 169 isoform X2 n=1 Tax=Sphaerodactylus townsendi TaxID=933632 RepID=UPI002025F6D9|nr:coiled-coil domain-containing protein 169 isoform X2 [Sphaerodactylus townsendi]
MGEGADGSELVDSERIMSEVEQEAQMKEALERSLFEMKNTVAELEKRLNSVEDQDNEWKTRYETQIELNRQLERQIGLFQHKMQHVCDNPADRLASVRSFDQMHLDSLNQFLKQLEEDKKNLQNQLKEYTLRLEQEGKMSGSLKSSERQKKDEVEIKRENQILRGRCNIPKNQRILDPKKGPIKKTAGVKHLPKLKL